MFVAVVVPGSSDTRALGRVVRLLDVVGLNMQVFIPSGLQKVFFFVCLASVLIKRRTHIKHVTLWNSHEVGNKHLTNQLTNTNARCPRTPIMCLRFSNNSAFFCASLWKPLTVYFFYVIFVYTTFFQLGSIEN